MQIFGNLLLGAAALLLVIFSPWFFLDPRGSRGFLDFTEVFWWAQWTGFWLLCASLSVFGRIAWRSPFDLLSRSAIGPGIGAAFLILFFVFSMPEASNQRDWCKGELGLPVYWKTKMRLQTYAEGVDGLPKRFAGTWKSGSDPVVEIAEDRVTFHNGAARTTMSRQTCPHRFALTYQFSWPSSLLEHFRYGRASEADFNALLNHDYPTLIVDCGMNYVVLVLLDSGRMIVLSRYATAQILKR